MPPDPLGGGAQSAPFYPAPPPTSKSCMTPCLIYFMHFLHIICVPGLHVVYLYSIIVALNYKCLIYQLVLPNLQKTTLDQDMYLQEAITKMLAVDKRASK